MYYYEPTALVQTLTHKRVVFHNFTIRDISLNNHENGTVNLWWCRVKNFADTEFLYVERFRC